VWLSETDTRFVAEPREHLDGQCHEQLLVVDE
jgi:hypothetical protein